MENSAVSSMTDLARLTGSATADRATLMRMKSQNSDAALKIAATEFAGIFLNQMYSAMAATVQTSEIFNGGRGEEIFRGMLNQEYSRISAYQDRTGLAQTVYQSLKNKQTQA